MSGYKPDSSPLDKRPFFMAIEGEVFSLSKYTCMPGRLERGKIRVGDQVELLNQPSPSIITIHRIQIFGKDIESASSANADNVVMFSTSLSRDQVKIGQILASPGSVRMSSMVKAGIYVLAPSEGGRSTPIFKGYRPSFKLRRFQSTVNINLPPGTDILLPGDYSSQLDLDFLTPCVLEIGDRFELAEDNKTVAVGVVEGIL